MAVLHLTENADYFDVSQCPELFKLVELVKELNVYSLRITLKHLETAFSDLEMASPSGFKESGFFHIGPRPADPVMEYLLLPTWQ